MAYRDDLEAARHQIDQLERRLAGHKREADERERGLRSEIAALEAELGRAREMPYARLWLVCWLPATAVAVLYAAAAGAAMSDVDGLAWGLAQASIVTAILATAWSWGRRGLLWPPAAFAALKLLIVVVWGWGWWHPLYSGLSHPSYGTPLYFFWCAPAVGLVIVLVEGAVIRAGLRPRPQIGKRAGNE